MRTRNGMKRAGVINLRHRRIVPGEEVENEENGGKKNVMKMMLMIPTMAEKKEGGRR